MLVEGLTPAGSGTPITLSMRNLGFEITGVSPAGAADSGSTTLTITGSHFAANTTATLISPSGATIAASILELQSSNTLLASFNLAGATPGPYSVQITDSGQTFTDPLAFQVLPSVQTLPATISTNTTLFGGVVYQTTGNVEVSPGVTLTIQPGAIIKFASGTNLKVDSGATLIADGSLSQPIIFTSIKDDANGGDTNGDGNATQPAAGDWGTILVNGTATFNYAQVLYGGGGGLNSPEPSTIDTDNSNALVTFTNGLMSQSFYDGFRADVGTINVSNSVLTGIQRAIAGFAGGTINVLNCTLDDNNIGIYADHEVATVTNCIITNSLDSGVDLFSPDYPSPTITYTDVYSTAAGSVNYSGMTDPTGTNGNISADPNYVNAAIGNYRLNYLSPCIDSGNASLAPATDSLGDPLYNDPRTNPKTGVSNSDGLYADMGALEFAESAPATIDLAASSVVGPAAAAAGQSATISWTETNLGSTSAVGGWADEIDLVLDPGPDQTVIPTGDVPVANGLTLGPNQSLNFSATVTVPGTVPGSYYWRVVPDATGDVFQGQNQGTGVAVSSVTTSLSLPALAVNGTAAPGQFTAGGQTIWLQVTPSDSEDLLLSLNSQAASGDIELYAAQGYIPTPSNFQFKSDQFDSPDPTLTIPTPSAGTPYYIAAYGRTLDASLVPFTLAATTPQFSVTGVSPTAIGNNGPSTIKISGGQLASDDRYQLIGPGGTFTATQFQVQDSSTVYATFNLQGATPGSYSVQVTPASGTPATLSDAVTVDPTQAAALSVQLLVPSLYRPGRVFSGEIVYENTGNVDMPAPLLELSAGGQAELSLDGTNFSTGNLNLLGVSFNGQAGVLRPDSNGRFPSRSSARRRSASPSR